MNLLESNYTYNPDILLAPFSQGELIASGIALIIGFAAYLMLGPITRQLSEKREAEKKNEKRRAINDLILMKELQGEIEVEMRESLIRSELRSGKE